MSYIRFLASIALAVLLALSCGEDKGTVGMGKRDARPIDWARNMHPRLLLTSGEQERLRSSLATTHKFLWDRYLQDLPGRLEAAGRPFGDDLNRGHAGIAPELAFAWAMTGSDEHYRAARDYLLRLADGPEWDPVNDLVHGHLLQGIALAYDILYQSMTPDERAKVAARLGRECEAQYSRMTTGQVWYRNQYFQNHAHSNFCGLAYAACALYGEHPEAPKWLALCEEFFETVFEVMPPDGGSLEGLSYGSYALEFICRYAELAKSLLARDYYPRSDYLRNSPDYLIHSLLPVLKHDEWAITFGDAPRHSNWHGPEPMLFLLATRYGNGAAQWLGRTLIELEPEGLASAGWWALFWYDPTVRPAAPAAFPTFHHLTDIDQVMMRSSWTDPMGTLIGLKAGPFMGRRQSRTAAYDWGTGHQDSDAGSFQIFSHGEFLAIDPLYTGFKLAANHSTLLVKGRGQLGDEVQWFAAAEALKFGHYPNVLQAVTQPAWDYVVADVAPAYHPALGLKQFTRHYLFIKPDILLLADQVTLSDRGIFHSWPSEQLETGGGLSHNSAGYVVGPQGEAWAEFDGEPGEYNLYCLYLDNHPGEGAYSFKVGTGTVHSWRNEESVTDYHLELSGPVTLRKGDRIAFSAAPMGTEARLLKLVAFSAEVPDERGAQWLLHLDPASSIRKTADGLSATLGKASLDLHNLSDSASRLDWELFDIKAAEIEPFTFRQTRRVSLAPEFTGDSALILTLIHTRPSTGKPVEELESGVQGSLRKISWRLDGKKYDLSWDLDGRKVDLR